MAGTVRLEQLIETTDYAALAALTFGLPNLPIDAARAALAGRAAE
ncbi:MAG TPA: hypothetical protein VGL99_08075 [Chloroflexota bacterium]